VTAGYDACRSMAAQDGITTVCRRTMSVFVDVKLRY
jgi:hypothetical protein